MIFALSGIVFAVFCVMLYMMRRDTLARGKKEQQAETYEHVLENIKDANKAADRFKSDADHAKRVQDRFTER